MKVRNEDGKRLGELLLKWENGEQLNNADFMELWHGIGFICEFLKVTKPMTGSIIYHSFSSTYEQLDKLKMKARL